MKESIRAIHDLQHKRRWEAMEATKTKYEQHGKFVAVNLHPFASNCLNYCSCEQFKFGSSLLSPVEIPSEYFEDPKCSHDL